MNTQEKQLKNARKRSSGKGTLGRSPKVSLASVVTTNSVIYLCNRCLMCFVVNCSWCTSMLLTIENCIAIDLN